MVYRKIEHNHTSDYEESEHSEDTEANSKNLDSKLSVGRKRRKSEHKSYLDDSDQINNDCWDPTTQFTPLNQNINLPSVSIHDSDQINDDYWNDDVGENQNDFESFDDYEPIKEESSDVSASLVQDLESVSSDLSIIEPKLDASNYQNPCTCTNINRDMIHYAPVNKAYDSSQRFCYVHFDAMEENNIIIKYEIDSFAGVIPSLNAFFKGKDLIFSEYRCNWSNSRLKDFSHMHFPKKLNKREKLTNRDDYMHSFALGQVKDFNIVAIRNSKAKPYTKEEFKRFWFVNWYKITHDAYKINLKTKNNTYPTERKLEEADKVISLMRKEFKFYLFVQAIDQKYVPYWNTSDKANWSHLQSKNLDFATGKKSDLQLDFSYTITNKATHDKSWTIFCNINLFLQMLKEKCAEFYGLYKVETFYNYSILDPSGVRFKLKKKNSSRLKMITLYSNAKHLTECNPECPNGPEFKYNNIYMGVLVATGLVNNDHKGDFRTITNKFKKYLRKAPGIFEKYVNDAIGFRVEVKCDSHDFKNILNDTESPENKFLEMIQELVTKDCFIKFHTETFAAFLKTRILDIIRTTNTAGIWGDVKNKINKKFIKKGLVTFATIGIFQTFLYELSTSFFPVSFLFKNISKIGPENKPFIHILELSWACGVLHIDPAMHDNEGSFLQPYRALGEAVENGVEEDHIKLLVDKNHEKQNNLEDEIQMAKYAFHHFVLYMYFKMDLLDTTGLSNKRDVLSKLNGWDGKEILLIDGKIKDKKVKVRMVHASDSEVLKLINRLFTCTAAKGRNSVDAQYFKTYRKFGLTNVNKKFKNELLRLFKTLHWYNNKLHGGSRDICVLREPEYN